MADEPEPPNEDAVLREKLMADGLLDRAAAPKPPAVPSGVERFNAQKDAITFADLVARGGRGPVALHPQPMSRSVHLPNVETQWGPVFIPPSPEEVRRRLVEGHAVPLSAQVQIGGMEARLAEHEKALNGLAAVMARLTAIVDTLEARVAELELQIRGYKDSQGFSVITGDAAEAMTMFLRRLVSLEGRLNAAMSAEGLLRDGKPHELGDGDPDGDKAKDRGPSD